MERKQRIEELKEQLTVKQAAFAEEYLTDLNGAAAARRAGYAHSSSSEEASRQLANVRVAELVALLKLQRSERTKVTADRVIAEIAKIAFSNPADVLIYKDGNLLFRDLDEIDNPEIVKGIKIKEQFNRDGDRIGQVAELTLNDKLRALELLGKHTAAFTENLNLTTNGKDLPASQTVVNVAINHRRRASELTEIDEDDLLA